LSFVFALSSADFGAASGVGAAEFGLVGVPVASTGVGSVVFFLAENTAKCIFGVSV
jgi:hypothetical protein